MIARLRSECMSPKGITKIKEGLLGVGKEKQFVTVKHEENSQSTAGEKSKTGRQNGHKGVA